MNQWQKDNSHSDRFAFIIRQYLAVTEQGLTETQAIKKLEANLPETHSHELSILSDWLNFPREENLTSSQKVLGFLSRMGSLVHQGGAQIKQGELLEMGYEASQNSYETFSEFTQNIAPYAITLLAITSICFAIFSLKVLPTFETTLLNQGHELPQVTQWVLNASQYIGLPLLVMVFGFIVIFAAASREINTALSKGRPVAGFCFYIPLLKELAQLIELRKLFILCQLFNTKLSAEDSLDKALQLTHPNQKVIQQLEDHYLYVQLHTAAALNNYATELSYLNSNKELFRSQLQKLKSRIQIPLFSAALIISGLVLISMYLPIFKLGGSL